MEDGIETTPVAEDGGQLQEDKLNPAWNSLLDKIPDQNLKKLITPELRQWDQNYNQGLQKVHSQYAPFKPFLDAQVDPEDLNRAMLVYQALQENPQNVIQGLMEFYGYQSDIAGQGQEPEDDDPEYDDGGEMPFDITQHPEFQRYQQMTELLAQQTLTQHEAQLEAQEDAELEQELAAARDALGEFDEDYVLQRMMYFNESAQDAAKHYHQFVQNAVQNYRSPGSQAPIIAGGGGGLPSQQTPVKGLSGADRRKLMVDALARAAQQGG